jgi:hypothetical protein
MINVLRRIPVTVWLVVFTLLTPVLSWAETSQQAAVTLGRETELLAVRALAFAGTEGPPPAATSSRPTLRPEEGFQAGTWHLGAKTGYVMSHKLYGPKNADVDFAPLFLQIGYTLTDVHGSFPVRGSLELIFEPTFMLVTKPSDTFGKGASLLLRYNFVTGTRWMPFFELGIGLLHWNMRVEDVLGSEFNFTILGGPGVNYFVTDNWAVTGQLGLWHASNAGRKEPNQGINSVMYLLGFAYYF